MKVIRIIKFRPAQYGYAYCALLIAPYRVGDEYEVMTWKQMMPDIENHMKADAAGFYVWTGILYLIIAWVMPEEKQPDGPALQKQLDMDIGSLIRLTTIKSANLHRRSGSRT